MPTTMPSSARVRLLVAALVPLLLAAIAPAAARDLTLEIGLTGTFNEFRFVAHGFKDEEEVSTWLTGPAAQVMATDIYTADDGGKVDFRMRMPRHFQPGRWAITIHGLVSDRELIGYFDVAQRGPDATATVTPARVAPGGSIAVTAGGFGDRERVSYWLTGSDGRTVPGPAFVRSTDDGLLTFSAIIPADAPPGQWTLSIYGQESDRLALPIFQVTP